MKSDQQVVQQSTKDVATRTSSNNMLCLVEYVPLTADEAAFVEELFEVAA